MKNKKILKISLAIGGIVLAILFCYYCYYQNNVLCITEHTISSEKISSPLKIMQISDFHNTKSKRINADIENIAKQQQPDIIVITGDLIDSRHPDVEVALIMTEKMVKIAPTFYVSGNHEGRTEKYRELKAGLESLGVKVLENRAIDLQIAKNDINLLGVIDPEFAKESAVKDQVIMEKYLSELNVNPAKFSILLTHRPELFDTYVDYGFDLVFAGHAHGGQVRIPLIGGLGAPNQGLFPKYDGKLTEKSTTMVVSRGIGNSILPLRINNRAEIVIVKLQNLNIGA